MTFTWSVTLKINDKGLLADVVGTSRCRSYGINVHVGYTKAYASDCLKCAIAPEIPNNSASLAPFKVRAPEGCILNAPRPSPVAVRHVLGHFVPDLVLGALHKFLPDLMPAEGAGTTWNIQISVHENRRSEEHTSELQSLMRISYAVFCLKK